MTTTLPAPHPVHQHSLREFAAPPPKEFLTFRVQQTIAQRLSAKALALGVDRSVLIRHILVAWLEQQEGCDNAYRPL
jgi:hypothetical protein